MNPFNENRAVGQLSELMALERGYTPAEAKQIKAAAILHDIGKQRISRQILDKPGKLTVKEFNIVKQHTKIGAEMLTCIKGSIGEMARHICEYHHEFENGKGYWEIPAAYLPDYVKFVSLADVYCALISSERPYKSAWSQEDALAYIQEQAGTRYKAVLVDVFVNLIRCDSRVPAIFHAA
jgi:putative two-component system response regulator